MGLLFFLPAVAWTHLGWISNIIPRRPPPLSIRSVVIRNAGPSLRFCPPLRKASHKIAKYGIIASIVPKYNG